MIYLHEMHRVIVVPSLLSERYRMALRMGGARAGKEIGERPMDGGMEENEVIRRVIVFMNYCKLGKITLSETLKVKKNREPFIFYESFGL